MKQASKKNIERFCITRQIEGRPNKLAKGIAYTNERRARQTNNSFFYAGFVDQRKYKQTDVCRTLSVRGTTDILHRRNSVKIYKMKQYRAKKKLTTF